MATVSNYDLSLRKALLWHSVIIKHQMIMAGSKSKVKKIDIAFIELGLPRNVKETIMQPNKITNASMSYNRRL